MMHLKALVVISLFVVSPGDAADGTEGRQWIGAAGPEGASLIYGTPQSDDVVIRFACGIATNELSVAFGFEPVGATDGMELKMELFSEGGAVVLNATGHRLLLDDSFVLEAKTQLDPALRKILTEGETLTIMAQDGAEEIPLSGAAERAAGLFGTCG